MWLADYVSLIIILSAFIWGIVLRRPVGGRFLLSAIIVIVIILGYTTYQQFLLWQSNEISKFLLPPHAPANYFIFYTFTRIWAAYVISFIVGILGYWMISYFNKRHQGKFFWPEEIYFIALSLFLAGHPGWILYLILISSVYSLWLIAYSLWLKKIERVSFYYLWLPLAAATIFFDVWLQQFGWYSNLIV